jgi:hypothetical protein
MRAAKRILSSLLIAAAVGLAVFGVMVYRAVTIQTVASPDALREFSRVRAALPPGPPLLGIDAAGNVVRRAQSPKNPPDPIRRLRVLAYHADTRRLVSAEVPFWFLKLKGPAAQLALRDTGFDLERLRITPTELARHGPSVVIDSPRDNGDRLLAWTER